MSPALRSSISTLADGLGGLPNTRSGLPRHPGTLRHKTGEAAASCPSCAVTWQEPHAAQRKGPVLPVSPGGAEDRLGFGSFREGHLPVPFCEVKCGDVPGPTEAIQELIHPRHHVISVSEDEVRR